jgi:cytochrome c peroxidase
MMLPADMALVLSPEFKPFVEIYAKDEEVFFKDFASAFNKLLELGVKFPEEEKKQSKSLMATLFGFFK